MHVTTAMPLEIPSIHSFILPRKHQPLISLALSQYIAVLLQRTADQLRLLPKVWRQESVGATDGDETGF